MIKYYKISTTYDEQYQIRIGDFQECRFLNNKKNNAKNHTGLGWGGGAHWGIGGAGGIVKSSRGVLSSPNPFTGTKVDTAMYLMF